MAAETKACTKCGEVKPYDEFCRNSQAKSGRHPACKACEVRRVSAWRKANPEKYAAQGERRKLYYSRAAFMLRRYGLTVEAYDELLHSQGGLCAICGKPCASGQMLSVDHDHSTGEVRGLLCKKCNMGIGLLGDSPDLLESAKKYLEAWS